MNLYQLRKSICMASILLSIVSAQTQNTLSGTVSDANSGIPLIGANVMVAGSGTGAATDVSGNFTLTGLLDGQLLIKISYIGYEDFSETVELSNGERKFVHFNLKPSVIQSRMVQVEGEMKKDGTMAVLADRKESVGMQDALSADQMSRSGDSNLADAMRRVTGLSITDGKFPVIRGLGNRYTTTQLNNGPVPSPEPDKKTVPLDLFPTALIENVTAVKTYTPDLPGVFAGGSINIKTKAYPERRIVNLKFSLKDKPYFYGNRSYWSSDRGSNDFWGFDDGTRSLPNGVPKHQVLSTATVYRPERLTTIEWYDQLSKFGKDFSTSFQIGSRRQSIPISFGAQMGNKYGNKKSLEYGFFTNLSFSNDFSSTLFSTNQYTYSGLSGHQDALVPYTARDNNRTEYSTRMGVNGSAGFNLWETQKIKAQVLYTHTSNDQTTVSTGYTPNIEAGLFIKQFYIEKSILNVTLSGHHVLPFYKNHFFEWNINQGISNRYEPDTRYQNYSHEISNTGTDSASAVYLLDIQGGKAGYRSFTDGFDQNKNLDMNYVLNWNRKISGQFKTGFRIQNKHRAFEKRSLAIINSSSSHWNTDVLQTNEYQTIGSAFDNKYYFTADSSGFTHGLLLVDETSHNSFNAYEADEATDAGYAMVRFEVPYLSNWVKTDYITGVRIEHYQMDLLPYNPVTGAVSTTVHGDTTDAHLDQIDLLPSHNFIVDFPRDVKLRLAYSHTVGRPEFRELAPIAYQEFYNGEVAVGFPLLKPTNVTNWDARLEWYPSANEIVAVSLFAKQFINPIEKALISTPDLTYSSYQNAKSAWSRGIEIEWRQRIPFLPMEIGHGTFNINTTLSSSEVVSDTVVTLYNGTTYGNSAANVSRTLQGHSAVLLNASVDVDFRKGYSGNISFNTFGKRIHSIGVGALGDEYEFPFNSLNLNMAKKFGSMKVSLKVNNMLNSSVRFGYIDPGSHELKLKKSYKPGQSYSLGVNFEY